MALGRAPLGFGTRLPSFWCRGTKVKARARKKQKRKVDTFFFAKYLAVTTLFHIFAPNIPLIINLKHYSYVQNITFYARQLADDAVRNGVCGGSNYEVFWY